jgi:hypothetical protein
MLPSGGGCDLQTYFRGLKDGSKGEFCLPSLKDTLKKQPVIFDVPGPTPGPLPRIAFSSIPTVLTQYPRDQKCFPVKHFFTPSS